MKKIYKLEDLDCAVCAQKMEDGIKKLDGVLGANVSFMGQKMTIEFADGADVNKIMDSVCKTCKKIEPDCVIKR